MITKAMRCGLVVLARAKAFTNRIMYLDGADNSTLEHVSLTGGISHQGAGIWIHNSQNVLLSGCAITQHVYDGPAGRVYGGGLYATGSRVVMTNGLIARNETRHQGGGANHLSQGGGIWSDGALTVVDSVIRDNIVETRDTRRASQGGGIYSEGPNLWLRNVLLYGNYSIRDQGDGLYIGNGEAVLQHCTIVDHAGTGVRRSGGTITMTHCIVWGNWTNLIGTDITAHHSTIGDGDHADYGANNISADPMFEYGYYLADGSPSIGAGSGTAADSGMQGYARNAGGDAYGAGDTINMGYHYATGFDVVYPDLYVAMDGNDANDGDSWPQALQTMSHALSLAHAGTRIHVADGMYSSATTGESYPLNVTDLTGIQILGATNGETIFDAAHPGMRVMDLIRSHRARLVNLTLTGADITDPDAPNNQGGGIFMTGYDLILKNVLIANNDVVGTSSGHGDGLYTTRKSRWTNQDITSADTRLVNGTVAGNLGEGIHRNNGDVSLLNTIVWNNSDDLVGVIEASYSIYGTGPDVINGGDNVIADPLFVDPGAGDYRLQQGSPAVDSGLNQVWMLDAVDLDGRPRILSGTVDLGCYEASPPPGTLIRWP